MLRIAITPEAIDEAKEHLHVRAILDAGWDRVHLRHPSASLADMRRLIERIPQRYHRHLVLHGHFELTNSFNLGGLHLNHRCPAPPALYSGPLSRSCHSIAELRASEGMAYVTLSPIFDSISKPGYGSRFTLAELRELDDISTPVIALGGVTAEQIPALSDYNFRGFAMLGALPWAGTPEEMRLTAESIRKI